MHNQVRVILLGAGADLIQSAKGTVLFTKYEFCLQDDFKIHVNVTAEQ
jgi:hypothetical protein